MIKSAQDLTTLVKSLFDGATDKKHIEDLAKIQTALDGVNAEAQALEDKNVELTKGYKDLLKHTSFKEEPKATETQPAGTAPDLDALLKDFLAKHPEEKD